MIAHVGTSGYAYKEWKGSFYPEKIPSKDMLRFYSERLDTVEINNTFYHFPTESVLSSWAAQVPESFLFAFKVPQVITHRKRLKDCGEETDYLFTTLRTLGARLGCVLFQFPETFRADLSRLNDFLPLVPSDIRCAFAFRSPSWLETGVDRLLREKGCALCIEDADESPASAITKTATWGYLRLRRSDYTEADLLRWSDMVRSQEWDRAFIFFKHENEAKAPTLAARFREHVGSV